MVDFSSVRTVLDVGCGGGGFAIMLAKACPHIKAVGTDLPTVVPIAKKIVAEQGLTDRVEVIAVDVVNESLTEPMMQQFYVIFFKCFGR